MTTIATHSGSFHADDVFSIAAFQLLLGPENIQIMRTRDEDVIASADYVVDVGGVYDHATKRYDHHQNDAPVRDNGIPYAGFGLMWRHYGEEICGSAEVAHAIEEKLCWAIDAGDNAVEVWQPGIHGIHPLAWDDIIKTWKVGTESDADLDEQFMNVVAFVREYLSRTIEKQQLKLEDKARAEKLYEKAEDRSVIVSDEPVSRRWFIAKGDVNVVVHPRNDGAWMAIAVEQDEVGYATKVSFPATWCGLKNEGLAEVSGLPDALFCHKSGYLFAAKSKESVVRAARMAK